MQRQVRELKTFYNYREETDGYNFRLIITLAIERYDYVPSF